MTEIRLGDAEIHLGEREVSGARGPQRLTELEASLIGFLAERRGSTVSREELLTRVWGYSPRVSSRAVDNTVSRLRRKLEAEPSEPRWLVSTAGGYRLEAEAIDPGLPVWRDTFVGREADLARLTRVLADGARLVTVLGWSGVGKTRFVARYAEGAVATYPGGVCFDLRGVDDEAGIHAAVGEARCHAKALWVLDGFERLASHADDTVGRWLRAASELRVVVTSQVRLGLPGEVVVDLPPLDQADAEALFVSRRSTANPGFSSGTVDRQAIAERVAAVDHLPVAIELLARDPLHPFGDLFERTFGRSWGRLAGPEQEAVTQLSAFDGPFTVSEAEATIGGRWAVDVLQSLLDRSWLRRIADDRLVLPRTVREHLRR